MDENTELYWLSQKIVSYQDPESATQLCVLTDVGLTIQRAWTTYIPLRVSLQVIDTRIDQQNGKNKYEMDFNDLWCLSEKLDTYLVNIKKMFENNASFTVAKQTYKTKKTLTFEFISAQNKKFVQITLYDPSAAMSKGVVKLNGDNFKSFLAVLKNYKDNYGVINSNLLNANNYNYRDLIRYSPPKHTPWTHAHNKEAMNEWDSNQIP